MGGGISSISSRDDLIKKNSGGAESTTIAIETIRITLDEVMKHNTCTDSWVIYKGYVYDLTEFLPTHPGGMESIMKVSGTDCTEIFYKTHPKKVFEKILVNKCIGYCDDVPSSPPTPPPPPPPPSSSTSRPDSPTTSWRKYCERISKKTQQSLTSSS